MKRVSFPQKPGHAGTAHRSKTDPSPGGRESRARLTIAAFLFPGLLLFHCEGNAPSRTVGGGCEYRDIPGMCRIETLSPSGSNTYGQRFRTLFDFIPDTKKEPSASGSRMVIGDGQDPTQEVLAEHRIEAGSRFRCIRKLRVRGPCSPEVFVFPDLKNIRGQGPGVRDQSPTHP